MKTTKWEKNFFVNEEIIISIVSIHPTQNEP